MVGVDHHLGAWQVCGKRAMIAHGAGCARLALRIGGPRCIRGRILARLVLGNRLFQILEPELQLARGQLFGAAAELMARQALDQQAELVVLGVQFALLVQHRAQHLLQQGGPVRQGVGVDLHIAMMDNATAPLPGLSANPARRPRKANTAPPNGSSARVCCTSIARPVIPLRMSVTPNARYTRRPDASAITGRPERPARGATRRHRHAHPGAPPSRRAAPARSSHQDAPRRGAAAPASLATFFYPARPQPIRDAILAYLSQPRLAVDIARHIRRPVPTTTGHLAAMRRLGLVDRVGYGPYVLHGMAAVGGEEAFRPRRRQAAGDAVHRARPWLCRPRSAARFPNPLDHPILPSASVSRGMRSRPSWTDCGCRVSSPAASVWVSSSWYTASGAE